MGDLHPGLLQTCNAPWIEGALISGSGKGYRRMVILLRDDGLARLVEHDYMFSVTNCLRCIVLFRRNAKFPFAYWMRQYAKGCIQATTVLKVMFPSCTHHAHYDWMYEEIQSSVKRLGTYISSMDFFMLPFPWNDR